MVLIYIQALKIYNETQPKWKLPKKNTPDYEKVMEIMKKLKQQNIKK